MNAFKKRIGLFVIIVSATTALALAFTQGLIVPANAATATLQTVAVTGQIATVSTSNPTAVVPGSTYTVTLPDSTATTAYGANVLFADANGNTLDTVSVIEPPYTPPDGNPPPHNVEK